jgi:hypothetical protein
METPLSANARRFVAVLPHSCGGRSTIDLGLSVKPLRIGNSISLKWLHCETALIVASDCRFDLDRAARVVIVLSSATSILFL